MRRIPVIVGALVLTPLVLKAVQLRNERSSPSHAKPVSFSVQPDVPHAVRNPFPAFGANTAFEEFLLTFPTHSRIESDSKTPEPPAPFPGAAASSAAAPAEQRRVPLSFFGGLLPTSGCEPPFAPFFWNRPEVRWGNNCYAYACDNPDPFRRGTRDFPQPGNTAGQESADPAALTCSLLRDRALADGLIAVGERNEDEAAPDGFYKVALFVAPGRDYHWYRQDPDGYWSHKLGSGPVRRQDASARPITDPRTSDRAFEKVIDPETATSAGQNYNVFGGFFLVPRGGIQLGYPNWRAGHPTFLR